MKKVLCILLGAALALCLAACGLLPAATTEPVTEPATEPVDIPPEETIDPRIQGTWYCVSDELELQLDIGAGGSFSMHDLPEDQSKQTLTGTVTVSGDNVTLTAQAINGIAAEETVEEGTLNGSSLVFGNNDMVFTREAPPSAETMPENAGGLSGAWTGGDDLYTLYLTEEGEFRLVQGDDEITGIYTVDGTEICLITQAVNGQDYGGEDGELTGQVAQDGTLDMQGTVFSPAEE